ncbi:hypothetical protein CDAR_379621 [Caerostris darwini]|uniref:Uncharacterized protein n=1 Tax=Caerostris darwini TaxID=1538125 RepID=A0AAV4RY01_9ARAC|nr:hypothetical protein CDAR_379621 [Caerostris darwini]
MSSGCGDEVGGGDHIAPTLKWRQVECARLLAFPNLESLLTSNEIEGCRMNKKYNSVTTNGMAGILSRKEKISQKIIIMSILLPAYANAA